MNMLKLTYSEFGLHLEQIAESLEQWVLQRTLLALRISEPLCVQPGNASFLIPAAAITASERNRIVRLPESVAVCSVDRDFYEVNIAGVWLTKNTHVSEGILVAELGDLAEACVHSLWESSQRQVPTYVAD
jgi:hypothetical protein